MPDLIIERFLAIDNICAWPNLTQLPDGEIIATSFNQPCHGHWQGDLDCFASSDLGRSWHYRGTPAPHEGTTVRMNAAAGLAHNGDLIVLASGWGSHTMTRDEFKAASAQPGFELDRGDVLCPWVCRSADAGKTWTIDKTAFPQRDKNQLIPFGDIRLGQGNRLHACAYHRFTHETSAKPFRAAYFFTSEDDGKSWQQTGTIETGDHNETTPLHLEGSRWMVASRTTVASRLDQFITEDDGRTWRFDKPLTLSRQHPGHLLRLRDGRILLCYGVRNRGNMGIFFQTSNDNAQSWSQPLPLVTYPDCDHGYPSTVENADGTLTTCWYAARHPAHSRYHMGAAIWKLPE